MINARKNPPSARNMSTERNPASKIKKNGFLATSNRLVMFSTPTSVGVEYVCPMTTHIIAIALTPSQTFRS